MMTDLNQPITIALLFIIFSAMLYIIVGLFKKYNGMAYENRQLLNKIKQIEAKHYTQVSGLKETLKIQDKLIEGYLVELSEYQTEVDKTDFPSTLPIETDKTS